MYEINLMKMNIIKSYCLQWGGKLNEIPHEKIIGKNRRTNITTLSSQPLSSQTGFP